MGTTSWPYIPAATLADQAYRAIRTRILDGQLAPGEFVRERDLHEAMGVSRTPVREALSRLASEGFLEKLPHRGFRVPEEPIGNLLELYPVIAALDLLAGKLALPRLTPADIARLKRTNDELAAAMTQDDAPRLVELNNAFHHVFGERSGNQELCALLDNLRPRLTRLERWYYSSTRHTRQSVREHARIIRAIERGDHAEALSLLETNMSLTYRSLLDGNQRRAAAGVGGDGGAPSA